MEVKTPQRQYAAYDSIAIQRHGADVKRREDEIAAIERSASVRPVNPMGLQDAGRAMMQSQIAQQIAEKREALNAVRELDGDARVTAYCAAEIAQAEQPEFVELRNSDGSPLARGASVQPIAPGMA